MSNYNFSPTLNGLNNLDSNNVNTDTIITDYLTVDKGSSVPTLPNGTNNNEIASTAFVQDAITSTGGGFVTLSTVQTITAEKTFLDNVNMSSGLIGNYIYAGSSLDTTAINSPLGTDNINIVSNQTSGILNLGCRNNRTGNINIGTLTTNNAPIVIGSSASTTQTATHNAITTFNKIPSCSIAP